MINKVQLITYPDSLGGNLKELTNLLNTTLNFFQGGIHILPPYPSSGDRGFAPINYFEIDEKFGSWKDIEEISKEYPIMLDVMVNHISRQSQYFQDFLQKGDDSIYNDMFITFKKLGGIPKKDDIDKMFLRREKPYSTYKFMNTDKQISLWTTFGKTNPSEQIDLDVFSPKVKEFFEQLFIFFNSKKIKLIRLDAVAYVTKKYGTNCFFVEPQIYDFLKWITVLAAKNDIKLLPEVHSEFSIQKKLSDNGFWIYDFILPYVVLHTLFNKDSSLLYKYLENRPENQFTMLDCHDGIPIKPDLDGLVDSFESKKIIEKCLNQGANLSYVFSNTQKNKDSFDVHQIRCTYYSALECDDDAYIVARAIQFFVPGIPQVYYVGFLAGENYINDVNVLEDGREINRQNFSLNQIIEKCEKNVVKRLIELIKFRNNSDIFNGKFNYVFNNKYNINFIWTDKNNKCELEIDLILMKAKISLFSTNENKNYNKDKEIYI